MTSGRQPRVVFAPTSAPAFGGRPVAVPVADARELAAMLEGIAPSLGRQVRAAATGSADDAVSYAHDERSELLLSLCTLRARLSGLTPALQDLQYELRLQLDLV